MCNWHLKNEKSQEIEFFSEIMYAMGDNKIERCKYLVMFDRPNGQQQQSGGVFNVNDSLLAMDMKLLSPSM